ncbi:MAG: hypothetical protein HQL18_01645 [Candidatus Omnitrophica bacterium]|nr:hypothetical protein [Candidatus Omnitrophota bacterium]
MGSMMFEELLVAIKKIKAEETRKQSEKYFEVVIAKTEMEALHALLLSYFGTPLKPAGERPGPEVRAYADPYGGIQPNQIMYFRQGQAGAEFALLWPWGSGMSLTAKIIRE